MKARLNGTKDPFVEITEVSLANKPYVVYDASRIEFEQELNQLNPEEEKLRHLETIRQQTAIAAMQGTITILSNSDRYAFSEIVVEGYRGKEKTYPKEIAEFAVACADALVEKLKGE